MPGVSKKGETRKKRGKVAEKRLGGVGSMPKGPTIACKHGAGRKAKKNDASNDWERQVLQRNAMHWKNEVNQKKSENTPRQARKCQGGQDGLIRKQNPTDSFQHQKKAKKGETNLGLKSKKSKKSLSRATTGI